jgi:hypothetical protein
MTSARLTSRDIGWRAAALGLLLALALMGLGAATARAAGDNVLLSQFNGKKTQAKSFGEPSALTTDAAGDVYVADPENNVVDEFAPPAGGKPVVEFHASSTPAGSFSPAAIAVNADGDLFVVDDLNHVVDEFAPSGEYVSQIDAATSGDSTFDPVAVAVNSSSDVYVASGSLIEEFAPSGAGAPIAQLDGAETGRFSPQWLAVDASGDVIASSGRSVYEFAPAGKLLTRFATTQTPQGSSFSPTAVAVTTGGEVYIANQKGPQSVARFSASGRYLSEFDGSEKPHQSFFPAALAVNAQDEVYVAYAESAAGVLFVDLFSKAAPAIPPVASISTVTAVSANSATVEGQVTPNGWPTTYRLEDSTDGVHWVSHEQASAGEGTTALPVSQTLTGLLGNTTYHVRLVAASAAGEDTDETTLTTLTSPPRIFGAVASDVTATKALLRATIYPEGQPLTTYRFEYGPTAAYGTIAPLGEGQLSGAPTQVSQELTGLLPSTTYHFRVVAANGVGAPTATPDQTFTTLAPGEGEPVGSCPNEALRVQSAIAPQLGTPYSAQLPDCRAYELVTPPFKSNNYIIPGAQAGAGEGEYVESFEKGASGTTAISSGGSSLLQESLTSLAAAGSDVDLNPTFYEIQRGPSGWSTSSLTPPAALFPVSRDDFASPADVGAGLWAAGTPSQPENAQDFYRREADGGFLDIGPIAPPASTAGPPRGANAINDGAGAITEAAIEGASSDLSHVLFSLASRASSISPDYLWPADKTNSETRTRVPSLYEYLGTGHAGEGSDVPTLVGLDNVGAQITDCGTGLGGNVKVPESRGPAVAGALQNAVSTRGSTVFFTALAGGCATGASGPGVNQLYARIGDPGATQVTVNVAGTSGCAASDACDVTSPPTYQGASADGSKVFFTTSQALSGDADSTNDLYECELPGDAGTPPAPAGAVNACPHLRAISTTGTTAGANVQSVLAVSEEGTRVYFTATGALTNAPNDQGRIAEAGQDNLYLWEAPDEANPAGRTAFIAALSEAAPAQQQATPDGRYLVFSTAADITTDDTSTVTQAFRYDAQTGSLIRVSVGQEGFNADGNTDVSPAILASTKLGRLTVSDDGSYIVFQSNAALTPQVAGGLHNIYEWHNGEVSLISDGTDSQNHAGLIGIDASGTNVFFTTADELVGQDTDEDVDIYDARIDGGFPAPTPAPSCSGEACQGPLGGSLSTPLLGSTGAPAIGNLPAPGSGVKGSTQVKGFTARLLKGSGVAISVSLPAKGRISASGAGLRSLSRSVVRAGVYKLTLALSAKEKLARKHHKLELKVKLVFRPSSGSVSSKTITVRLKRT